METNGWALKHTFTCASTNDAARDMPAWQAVYADEQTSGRGRFGRAWQSNKGGLWMSAVIPASIQDARSKLMPLAAGCAVAETFKWFGVTDVRLRWPNDIMIGAKKCAGILVDRFHPDRCVVGIGVNVFNDPSLSDKSLEGHFTRLSDLLPNCPDIDHVANEILILLREIVDEIKAHGPGELLCRLAPLWKLPRRVMIEQKGTVTERHFLGVDEAGRILLKKNDDSFESLEPHEIDLLREI